MRWDILNTSTHIGSKSKETSTLTPTENQPKSDNPICAAYNPLPLTPGVSPIGRVDATGSDTTTLKPGQLVYVDLSVRARDDPLKEQGIPILQGLFGGITPEARILSENHWHHGSWAEKQIVPLENVHVLNESLLLQQMGYSPARLTWIDTLLVPYGGLLSGALQPGETVILCFATGHFGGAAIDIALAIGAGG
ncbi:hypothetical protein CNMCM5793_006706 [Aspergillus hiratsukae]|uniref:Alcohol dehydrogenase-like N-terminal domain-containing protein n=1 Tax=Aspergillus hiratsukae TaxID=1194566 RepID=A0A8H6UB60_9EURO|nr:hypothetical protein CNMCM5793_006706 [Aspergillus hiratsukae]